MVDLASIRGSAIAERDGGQLFGHHTIQNGCGLQDLSGCTLENQKEGQGQNDLTDGEATHWLGLIDVASLEGHGLMILQECAVHPLAQ